MEIGSEATPADFLDVLLDLTEEWARVLAPHGSICVELGDTYAGSGGRGEASLTGTAFPWREQGWASEARDTGGHRIAHGPGWPLSKSLCGIPTLYAWSLAYGRNLLRPERETDPWRIRNLGTWLRPNPPVGALGDKVRPASSFITIATKARNRWFDLDAVRQPLKSGNEPGGPGGSTTGYRGVTEGGARVPLESHPLGAPPLDWHSDLDPDGTLHLILATEPYSGSHYATFPRRLPEKFVQMMCPLRVCTVCGEPSRRIVEKSEEYAAARAQVGDFKSGRGRDSGLNGTTQYVDGRHMDRADNVTVGWSDCGCSTDGSHWRNGVVLDPFGGSGTTGAVSTGHGRNALLIDIDERNAALAFERIGPLFLEVATYAEDGSHVPDWLVSPRTQDGARASA